jgi:hypothetical protein
MTIAGFETAITNALQRQGRFWTTVRVSGRPAGDFADLVVEIPKQGSECRAESLEVKGAQKVPADEILRCAGIVKGQRLTVTDEERAVAAVYASGQFRTVVLTAEPVGTLETVKVVLHVTEGSWSKPIAEAPPDLLPLTKTFASYLEHPERWEEDLVWEASGESPLAADPAGHPGAAHIGVVWRPRTGAIIQLHTDPSFRGNAPVDGILTVDRKQFAWISTTTRTVGVCAYRPVGCTLDMFPGSDGGSRLAGNLSFGMSLFSYNQGETIIGNDATCPRTSVRIAPGVAYVMAQAPWKKSKDGLTWSSDTALNEPLTITPSGRIISISVGKGAIRTEAGAYDRALRAVADISKDYAPGESAPWAFVRDVGVAVNAEKADIIAASRVLYRLCGAAAAPFLESPETEPFVVHLPFAMPASKSELLAMYGPLVMYVGDRSFPRYSCPWTLCHQTGFVLLGVTEELNQECQRLLNDERTGPVSYLLISAVLRRLDPKSARAIAGMGLTACNRERFRLEMEFILDDRTLAGKLSRQFIRSVTELPDADIAALSQLGGGPDRRARLIEVLQWVRDRKNASDDDLLFGALDRAWPDLIQPLVKRGLEKCGGQATTSSPGAAVAR